MIIVAEIAAVVIALAMLAYGFVRMDARSIASALRSSGPMALLLLGLAVALAGRVGIGGAFIILGLGWLVVARYRGSRNTLPAKRSTVRTAALEMELDHASGALDGVVLAGSYEGRRLTELNLRELLGLYRELVSDSESRQLLETYLDGRFPVWRQNGQAHGGERLGVAPGAGAMTKEEAYKILGLEAGATAADIREAHSRLMQRLHPDVGSASFLAARINEAKDILLTNHS